MSKDNKNIQMIQNPILAKLQNNTILQFWDSTSLLSFHTDLFKYFKWVVKEFPGEKRRDP